MADFSPVPAATIGGESQSEGMANPNFTFGTVEVLARGAVACIVLTGRKLSKWFWPYQPTAKQIDGLVKLDSEDNDGGVSGWALTKKWCAVAKAEFGTVQKRTPANDAAIADKIRRLMKEANTRNVDIIRVLPWAVASVYVPTDADLVAASVYNHKVVKARRKHLAVPQK
ncbi:hypothetical protein 1 [Shahe tombus-like virus 2]|uniref:hypothetical protein 1 n=1 Tax=Shahe tombus-like virus 2 TaxID=1923456 RepID=UPI0009095E17|nr:hypothetical protein 1 [Shahe tombus-like virus 2]APG76363.1 hypothetical protein 1 [Shahe tombus-like virus 2]